MNINPSLSLGDHLPRAQATPSRGRSSEPRGDRARNVPPRRPPVTKRVRNAASFRAPRSRSRKKRGEEGGLTIRTLFWDSPPRAPRWFRPAARSCRCRHRGPPSLCLARSARHVYTARARRSTLDARRSSLVIVALVNHPRALPPRATDSRALTVGSHGPARVPPSANFAISRERRMRSSSVLYRPAAVGRWRSLVVPYTAVVPGDRTRFEGWSAKLSIRGIVCNLYVSRKNISRELIRCMRCKTRT